MINLGGTKQITDAKFGDRQVKSIYLGNGLVWKPSKIYDCEIDYLESFNGNCWFRENNIFLNLKKVNFEIGFWDKNIATQRRYVALGNNYILYTNSSKYLSIYDSTWKSLSHYPRGPYNVVNINYSTNKAVINGNTVNINGIDETDESNIISLFGSNNNNLNSVTGRLYYFKLWYDGELLYDLVPVRKKNVGYLYDRIHNVLWENKGTEPWGLGKDIIPFEQFTQLDYIENTTTGLYDYIDIQYFANNNTQTEIHYQFSKENYDTTNTEPVNLFGTRGTSYNNNTFSTMAYWPNNTYTGRIVYGNRSNTYTESTYLYNKTCQYRNGRLMSLYKNIDDVEYYKESYIAQNTATFKALRSMFLFNENGNDAAETAVLSITSFVGKIYSFKIHEGETLVKDLVPVRHKDGTYGFYDLITNKFHYGNNPSTFTGGNEFVKDTYDAQIEYLETDGNAFIDSNIAISNHVNFEIDMFIPDFDTERNIAFFGGRNEANAQMCMLNYLVSQNTIYWNYSNKYHDTTHLYKNQRYLFHNEYGTYPTCNKLYIGDNLFTNSGTTAFGGNKHFYLFDVNNNTGGHLNMNLQAKGTKIYSAKLYVCNVLVRDFIPVRKNGIGYLYDKVSGKLFGNANTEGNFILGNDIQ